VADATQIQEGKRFVNFVGVLCLLYHLSVIGGDFSYGR
jgi:hypothetical protein